jgi:dienelactone hydrolase
MSKRNNRANLTDREFLYRSSFELGRHLVGYEVQKVLAVVDWFAKDAAIGGGENADPHIAVMGYGEGGMIALYAAALDTRIDSVLVSGYFGNRNTSWHQPIDRNVFGLLDQFGDAELLSMVFPRSWVVEAGGGPKVSLPGEGGAPAILLETDADEAEAEWKRYTALVADAAFESRPGIFTRRRGDGPASFYYDALSPSIAYAGGPKELVSFPEELPRQIGTMVEEAQRQKRQVDQIDQHNQLLLIESPYVRAEYMKELYDAANTKDLAAYQPVVDKYRAGFYDEVVGRFDDELLPPNPRSRKSYETDKWTGYEVVLDVWPDVIAYGILLVPKGMVDGERRPVVVCQHGLEGRPQHVIEGDHGAYHDYAAKLAERGFITFAPQNLYIFQDRFRTLQRKANPLGKTLFSVIVPQHQQIVDWLGSLPYVDPERIAFYGLSYGGKSAMRIPALVPDYCLSICSADFNEWVWKNASTRSPYSYVWTGEYEIFEFDLGSTFNYAEMAAIIAPRPFMVERGHFDGVAPDEAVAYEFAKVRHHYAARLGMPDRAEIEWFVGPHTINGQGTFRFLHKHLEWPEP